jgi:hypothetical protein
MGMPFSTWFCYLKKTHDLGIRFAPNPEKGFKCYCDADFFGNWTASIADVDPSTSKSHSGWVIFYAGCPIIWASKLQIQTALSTTEAEYIAMSMSFRDVIPIMELIKEMKEHNIPVICTNLMSIARYLKITPEPLSLPDFLSFALAPSTSTCATIIFASMSVKD